MAANRILYVSYNPETLVRDEQLLIRAGYEVDSVFGTDGLMACGSVGDYASVLIDHACPLDDRTKVISWLKTTSPEVNILPADWVQEYAVGDSPALASAAYAPSEQAVIQTSTESSQASDSRLSPRVEVHQHSQAGSQKEVALEFRLLYRGKLPAGSSSDRRRKQQIHMIRKQFHQQLQLLWQQHRALSGFLAHPAQSSEQESFRPMFEMKADNFARCGYRFLPLVSRETGLGCGLEILLLRRDDPAGLIRTAGGMENRLNLLLAALRMPSTCDEVGDVPDVHEDPFYVLMEDDSLVDEVTISTDRLLTPLTSQDALQDVLLLIHVKTTVLDLGV
jgi:hypothetical protein